MFRLFTTTARRSRISRTTNRLRLRLEHLETRDTPSTTVLTAPDNTDTSPVAALQDSGFDDGMVGSENEFGEGESSECTLSISLSWSEEGGMYFLSGSVSAEEDVYGMTVSFSSSIGIGGSATVGSNGEFWMSFSASPGTYGNVIARVTDSHGHTASADTTVSI